MKYKLIRLKDLYPLIDERGYTRENDEFHWQFIHETLLRLKELEREFEVKYCDDNHIATDKKEIAQEDRSDDFMMFIVKLVSRIEALEEKILLNTTYQRANKPDVHNPHAQSDGINLQDMM